MEQLYTASATIKGERLHFFMVRQPSPSSPLFTTAEVERLRAYLGSDVELAVEEAEGGQKVAPAEGAQVCKFPAEAGHDFPEGAQGYDMPFLAWYLPSKETTEADTGDDGFGLDDFLAPLRAVGLAGHALFTGVDEEEPEGPTPSKEPSPFGNCPHCQNEGINNNVGRVHWFTCEDCRVKWRVGENLFGTWREQTDEDNRRIARRLMAYREVDPVMLDYTQGLPGYEDAPEQPVKHLRDGFGPDEIPF